MYKIHHSIIECIVNLSKSGDYNFCHTHKDKIVLLYYVNLHWHDGFGGETLFYDDDLINAKSVSLSYPLIKAVLNMNALVPYM